MVYQMNKGYLLSFITGIPLHSSLVQVNSNLKHNEMHVIRQAEILRGGLPQHPLPQPTTLHLLGT